nr:uncharacterized protein LOC117858749 isoform X2 [Setaria viridis]
MRSLLSQLLLSSSRRPPCCCHLRFAVRRPPPRPRSSTAGPCGRAPPVALRPRHCPRPHSSPDALTEHDVRNYDQLPPESIHAKRIEEHAMSVVRLCIARTKKNKGLGIGFIVVNTANKLVVMTCGHSLNEWVKGTKVGVTFYNRRDSSAEAMWVNTEKEVALLLISTSPISNSLRILLSISRTMMLELG